MASVNVSDLSKQEKDELAVSYAALMLHDDGLEITAEKLAKVCKDSGNDVEPYWPMLFAKALKSHKIGDLLSNLGAPAGGAAGPAAAAGGPAAEAVEEKVEEEEEIDIGTGGFFDEEDDGY